LYNNCFKLLKNNLLKIFPDKKINLFALGLLVARADSDGTTLLIVDDPVHRRVGKKPPI
jgi:hypothetical protein